MRRLSIFFVLLLVAAACNGDAGETTTTVDEITTSTEAVETTTTTAAADTTTTAPSETTTTAASSGAGGPDCLVGTWELDNESFVEAIRTAFDQPGMNLESVEPAGGTYTVELGADGEFSGTRDEWGFVIAMAEGTLDILINGTESGTWSADDSTLTVNSTGADVDVSMTMEVDGVTTELPSSSADVPGAMQTASSYSCEGDTLSVTSEGVTTVMNRA